MYSQTHPTHPIEEHPDLLALRAASEGAVARPAAQAVECLSLLAGVYLAISPWVVGFHASAATLAGNNVVTGLVLVALALGFAPAFERTHSLSMAGALIGVWTIIAPWAIHSSPTDAGIIASNVVVGSLIFLLALMTLRAGMAHSHAAGADRTHSAATGGPATRPDRPDGPMR